MKDFERRLADLERAIGGGREILIIGPPEVTIEAALRELDLKPGKQGTVHYFVSGFSNTRPELVKIHPSMGPSGHEERE